jgi:hypothetical protein
MTTISDSSSMEIHIEEEGASLSVYFNCTKFPRLFGDEAYAGSPDNSWAYIKFNDADRPRFTERNGEFAPYKKASLSRYARDDEGEECPKISFEVGSLYSKTFRVRT